MTEVVTKKTSVHAIYTVMMEVKDAPPTKTSWGKQIIDPAMVRISYDSDGGSTNFMPDYRIIVNGPRILKGGKHGGNVRMEFYLDAPAWVKKLADEHAPDWSTIFHGS